MKTSRLTMPLNRTFRWTYLFPLLILAIPARAVSFDAGELKGSFDTTLSVGGIYRLENHNPD